MEFSEEQKEIIFSTKDKVLVDAKPGTGKTTTLIGVAEENFDKSILYIVFSKNLKIKGRQDFPVNTEVHTVNSFAFNNMKNIFGNREIVDEYKVLDIVNMIPEVRKKYERDRFGGIVLSNKIINKLNSFFNSKLSKEEFFLDNYIDRITLSLYNDLINYNLKLTHGFILKFFADNFDFSIFDYDIVLVDEAQDINPVMLLILEKIGASREVFVGDKRQSIFGFRELLNIFEIYRNQYSFFDLNRSYRFGNKIGDFISRSTEKAYGEDFNLISNDLIESEVSFEGERNYGIGSAYIARTNNHLLEIAFEEAVIGTNISIPYEWEEIKDLLLDVFYLKIGQLNKIKNVSLRHLTSFSMLEEAISQGYHIEMSFLVNIINNYDLSLMEYIKILESQLSSVRYADLILITSHKSKGLEFLSVELGSDFQDYYSEETSIEEKNLVYVGMTRAINKLLLPKELLL